MSRDPNILKTSICEAKETAFIETQTAMNNANNRICAASEKCTDSSIKIPILSNSRNRKNVSPSLFTLNESFADPHSPSSSSTTSQATSANDATFEPTIEMMVNDFDDEQTLNEEEALASLELQDPNEEINTLKKESEMPLEELLAKYRSLPPLSPATYYQEPIRNKMKKKSLHKEKQRLKHKKEIYSTQISNNKNNEESTAHMKANLEYFDGERYENNVLDNEKADELDEKNTRILTPRKSFTSLDEPRKESLVDVSIIDCEIPKVRRSHLLDLYPEGTFDNVTLVNDTISGNSKETFYGVEDDEEIEEEDEDYKKKVMIGTLYQATIPVGLSQYGDILPYENEDKLIWEPCQVSEREVEEYLIRIRDFKSNQQGEENEQSVQESTQTKENGRPENNVDNMENYSILANGDNLHTEMAAPMDMDNQSIVKDNEQALHLLVQCGYDFKEALRRKRLNALPLNDCMSLWSEEECHKFEEGIQKYGKDFLKIRQNQVRTRTMRELVQFYYLWKKSERRDQNFANADTVDHMDIYLNEDNEYGSNPGSSLTPLGSPVSNSSNCTGAGRNSNSSLKNISIMTTTASTQPVVTNLPSEKNISKTCLHQQHHKKRTHSCNQPTLTHLTSDFNNSEIHSNTIANFSKC